MSLMWGAIVGPASIIPYFYSVFFITVLVHRCGRDFERYVSAVNSMAPVFNFLPFHRCSIKYGKDWERYCRIVKYKFIPGVY
jgi:delta24(24(1))-sterol reductase